MLPKAALLAAALAQGRAITVVVGGHQHVVPELPPAPAAPPPPDPVEVLGQRLREFDEAARQHREEESARVAAAVAETRELLGRVVAGQEQIVETLMLPVVPTGYDKSGRITSAQRKKE